jgi:hypothetical protein
VLFSGDAGGGDGDYLDTLSGGAGTDACVDGGDGDTRKSCG